MPYFARADSILKTSNCLAGSAAPGRYRINPLAPIQISPLVDEERDSTLPSDRAPVPLYRASNTGSSRLMSSTQNPSPPIHRCPAESTSTDSVELGLGPYSDFQEDTTPSGWRRKRPCEAPTHRLPLWSSARSVTRGN